MLARSDERSDGAVELEPERAEELEQAFARGCPGGALGPHAAGRTGEEELEALLRAAPLMSGAEYLSVPVLRALWDELGQAFVTELSESGDTLAEFLKSLDAHLRRARDGRGALPR